MNREAVRSSRGLYIVGMKGPAKEMPRNASAQNRAVTWNGIIAGASSHMFGVCMWRIVCSTSTGLGEFVSIEDKQRANHGLQSHF